MEEENKGLDTLVQEKIDTDDDFQASLAVLNEDEQAKAIAEKKAEILKHEYEALADKAKKAEEIAKNQEIRAKKAEALAKTSPKAEKPAAAVPNLKDIRALQDVPDEDVDEVIRYAEFQGISIAEAKIHPVMKTTLKIRAEERATAAAANTGTTKRVNKVDGDALLEKATSGAEMTDEEMREAARLRLQKRVK